MNFFFVWVSLVYGSYFVCVNFLGFGIGGWVRILE